MEECKQFVSPRELLSDGFVTAKTLKYKGGESKVHSLVIILEHMLSEGHFRHGCILSLILFLLVIGSVPHIALTGGRRQVQWTMLSFLKREFQHIPRVGRTRTKWCQLVEDDFKLHGKSQVSRCSI